jgi:hypothetical protein
MDEIVKSKQAIYWPNFVARRRRRSRRRRRRRRSGRPLKIQLDG